MKFGFTGTQQGMTDFQKVAFLKYWLDMKFRYQMLEFHQGQCIGADEDALRLVLSQGGVWTVSHPPIIQDKVHTVPCDEVWLEKPYLERNHDIVDACDFLLVAPKTLAEERRSGTWATYRYAKSLRKPIHVFNPF